MNGGGLQSLLGILAVFALIGACAWGARRLQGGHAKPHGMIKLVGGAMVGARERVVVVEVNGAWIVLGVAPGRVNALHVLPKPEAEAAANPRDALLAHAAPAWAAFATRLRQLMEKPHATRG